MAWEIWKQRNNWVFERVRSSIEQVCRKVRMQVMERVAMELSGAAARVRWICWTPPPVGVIKANFDAAFGMTDGLQRDAIGAITQVRFFLWQLYSWMQRS